jgi:hypothetical protein
VYSSGRTDDDEILEWRLRENWKGQGRLSIKNGGKLRTGTVLSREQCAGPIIAFAREKTCLRWE